MWSIMRTPLALLLLISLSDTHRLKLRPNGTTFQRRDGANHEITKYLLVPQQAQAMNYSNNQKSIENDSKVSVEINNNNIENKQVVNTDPSLDRTHSSYKGSDSEIKLDQSSHHIADNNQVLNQASQSVDINKNSYEADYNNGIGYASYPSYYYNPSSYYNDRSHSESYQSHQDYENAYSSMGYPNFGYAHGAVMENDYVHDEEKHLESYGGYSGSVGMGMQNAAMHQSSESQKDDRYYASYGNMNAGGSMPAYSTGSVQASVGSNYHKKTFEENESLNAGSSLTGGGVGVLQNPYYSHYDRYNKGTDINVNQHQYMNQNYGVHPQGQMFQSGLQQNANLHKSYESVKEEVHDDSNMYSGLGHASNAAMYSDSVHVQGERDWDRQTVVQGEMQHSPCGAIGLGANTANSHVEYASEHDENTINSNVQQVNQNGYQSNQWNMEQQQNKVENYGSSHKYYNRGRDGYYNLNELYLRNRPYYYWLNYNYPYYMPYWNCGAHCLGLRPFGQNSLEENSFESNKYSKHEEKNVEINEANSNHFVGNGMSHLNTIDNSLYSNSLIDDIYNFNARRRPNISLMQALNAENKYNLHKLKHFLLYGSPATKFRTIRDKMLMYKHVLDYITFLDRIGVPSLDLMNLIHNVRLQALPWINTPMPLPWV